MKYENIWALLYLYGYLLGYYNSYSVAIVKDTVTCIINFIHKNTSSTVRITMWHGHNKIHI